jgi:hypothetical protein
LEIFPGSFGNVSCIENAFGTVKLHTASKFYSVLLVMNADAAMVRHAAWRKQFDGVK